jgi:hypothetical protein
MGRAVTLPPHVDDVNRVNSVTSARLLVNVLARTCDNDVTLNSR